jgi:hypothetical protein
MKPIRASLVLLALMVLPISVYAQTLRGIISDAQTGEPLPSANIVIKDTYTGTISNTDGEFELRVRDLPFTLVIRYIGYFSQEIQITRVDETPIEVRMVPNVRELGEVTVTGGNPADDIMREVIRRKQIWRETLASYTAQAYTRQRLESDTSIASISETLSEVFWDKEKGTREVIKSRRQTANLGMEENFASAGFLPNFYDDNLEIGGFDMVGPTHPDAFRFYNFELVGLRSIDNLTVFDIKVSPRRRLQPTFEGTIAVVDSAYALLEIDLKPNDALIFPPPIQKFNLWFTQQFSNFGGDYWLPIDVRIRGEIKFGIVGLQFPEMGIQQLSRLTDYQVNTVLPDSLYEDDNQQRRLRVDTVSVKLDSLFLQSPLVVPLTSVETKAYAELDSTKTLDEAFRPKGFLARFIDNDDDDGSSRSVTVGGQGRNGPLQSFKGSITPDFRFTRVDGLNLSGTISYPLSKRVSIFGGGGYSFASKKADYTGGTTFTYAKMPRFSHEIRYNARTQTRYESITSGLLLGSTNMIVGTADYFDYYRSEGVSWKAEYNKPRSDGKWEFIARNERHGSLDKVTDYSLLEPSTVQRPNPAIEEGWMRSVSLTYTHGDDLIPFEIVGQNRIEVEVELADPSVLASDFDFARVHVAIDRSIPTFYKRRFLPNTLYVRLLAGASTGELPLQRFMIVDSSPGYYSPYGALKTLKYHPYEGEHYMAVHWEHNFRTIPFEALGMMWFARKGWSILMYGSHARTYISNERLNVLQSRPDYALSYYDGTHHELGVSLNGIFGLGRVNLTKRLDKPGLNIGFGVARYF